MKLKDLFFGLKKSNHARNNEVMKIWAESDLKTLGTIENNADNAF